MPAGEGGPGTQATYLPHLNWLFGRWALIVKWSKQVGIPRATLIATDKCETGKKQG